MNITTMMRGLQNGEGKPLLLADEGKLEQIRNHPFYAPHVKTCREKAERFSKQDIRSIKYSYFKLFDETGDRTEFQRIYMEHREMLIAFAMACLIDGTHAADLEDIIWAICDEYSWCLTAHFQYGGTKVVETLNDPPRGDGKMRPYYRKQETMIDLCAAATASILAEVTAMFEDKLAPIVVYRARTLIRERVLEPFMQINTPFFWETAEFNWSAVCAGNIGIAAIYMIDDSRMLAPILSRVTDAMDCFLTGFGEDGVCQEGLGYWDYGFGNFIYFADLLRRRTDGAIDLFENDHVRNVALFEQRSFLNGVNTISFSDCAPQVQYEYAIAYYLKKQYPEVEIPPLACAKPMMGNTEYWTTVVRSFLWSDPEEPIRPFSDQDLYLPDAQWVISRKTMGGHTAAFAAKGGHNDEPHNHNDLGSFLFDVDEEVFLCDLGGGLYTKQYFGDERYQMLVNGSQGHSVPIVDGIFQKEGRQSCAEKVDAVIGEDAVTFSADIAKAYPGSGLKSLLRKLTFAKKENPSLLIQDTAVFADAVRPLTERLITKFPVTVEKNQAVIRGNKGELVLTGSKGTFFVSQTSYKRKADEPDVEVYLLDLILNPNEPGQTGGDDTDGRTREVSICASYRQRKNDSQ
ncbi:MAG: heparinase II/III family protein [Lachnospiraceae bacterium]|nr:heparinase II/III family protein [Candidatus Fimimorpha excrementavium]